MSDMLDISTLTLLGQPLGLWLVFFAIVAVLLILDLGVLNRSNRVMGVKESLRMSAFYIAISLLFSLFIHHYLGAEATEDYINGYIIEKTLSLDNLFIMSVIFSYFSIPREYQHRVLFWGIIGVIFLRGMLIGAGTALVEEFSWTLYVFSAFLILTGIKMLFSNDETPELEKSRFFKFLRRHLPITDGLRDHHFFTREEKGGRLRRFVTPLFVALLVIEFIDLIFALDSVPAIFAITTDSYVVFTSNIFAVLGLRALYFAIAAAVHRFAYMQYALAILLLFIGSKIFIADALGMEEFPQLWSLLITFVILSAGIGYSLFKTKTAPAHSDHLP